MAGDNIDPLFIYSSLCEELSLLMNLLAQHGEHCWHSQLRESMHLVRKKDIRGLDKLLSLYGGMGSLNDLVVRATNQHDQETLTNEVGTRLARVYGLATQLQRDHRTLKDWTPSKYRYEWERPIFFEGIELPGSAIEIDVLGMYGHLPEMSEEASLWLWHFTICVGVEKSDESAKIIPLVREVLGLVTANRSRLLNRLKQTDGQTLDEWILTLNTILEVAGRQPYCTWTAPIEY